MRSRLSWLTLLLGAFLVSLPFSSSLAQPEAYSLHQVIASLDSTSPILAEARTNLARARAAFTSSRAFPNPALFGTQETLNDAASSTERVIGVRQNLGFLWSLPFRHASTKATYEAAQAAFVEARRELIVRAIEQVYEYDRLQRQSDLMDSVLIRADQLAEATTARRRVGDIAPYDEQRFHLEQVQLQNRKQELQREASVAQNELVRLCGLPVHTISSLALALPSVTFTTEDEAVRYAQENRPELRRSELQVTAARRALSQARWDQLPDFSVGAGNKQLDPGPSGLYLEGELEIPLWNQRRSDRNVARAELLQAELEHVSQQKLVEQEVRAAYRRLQLIERLQPSSDINLADSASVNMSRGVRLYLEGEMNALELVDALRTGIESQDAALMLRNSLAVARAEMRRVSGLDPLEQ